MTVIGHDHGDAGFPGETDQERENAALIRQAVIHELDEIMIFSENLLHFPGVLCGILEAPVQQELVDPAGKAGRTGNQALVIFAQQREIHPWLIIVAADKAFAD